MRLSAYMSIFDDWDILPLALKAVAPLVDEIVIVDGAYRWMAPMLRANGRNPQHSLTNVAACLIPYLDKIRIVSGLWDDEMQKRSAGYAACKGRYILRFDADEIMFLTPALIDAAIARDYPVVSVEMPTYTLPGWISTYLREDGTLGDIERQCVFFDRTRIGIEEHLTYLWLVLGNAEKARLGHADPAKVDPVPLGYNAHLTCWRTPRTSVHRARFYVMNWMRDAGTIPWLGGITAQPEDGFAAFFAALPPAAFESLLLGHEIAAGQPGFGKWTIRKAPPSALYDPLINDRFDRFVQSLADLNHDLARAGRLMLSDVPCCIDLSTASAVAALSPRGHQVALTFDQQVTACEASVLTVSRGDGEIGHCVSQALDIGLHGNTVTITLPGLLPDAIADLGNLPIRQTLVLLVSADWTRELRLQGVGDFPASAPTPLATPPLSLSAASLQSARAATEASDWKLAADRWAEVIAANPGLEEAHLRLGEALLADHRFDIADAVCLQAWRLFPDNMWIGRNWARTAMRASRWSVAIDRFREVLGRNHAHDALQADLAECLWALDRPGEAAAVVVEALRQFPSSSWLLRLRERLPAP